MGANMFRRASDWLDAQRHEHATSSVLYRRGDRMVELNATIGRTEFQQDDGYGIIVRLESRDYIVRAIDLAIDGVATLPEVGDRIEEIQCGETYVYEVLPIGASQQHWRFSDQFRQTVRIHTRQIGGRRLMSSVIVDVAAAVVDELEEGTFAIPFALARGYVPHYDLKEMDGVRVTVVPREDVLTNLDRARMSNAIAIDVAVQRKVSSVDPSALDPLMSLVQQISDFLSRRTLTSRPDASWTRTENKAIYAPEHLTEKRLFTAVITLTYTLHQ